MALPAPVGIEGRGTRGESEMSTVSVSGVNYESATPPLVFERPERKERSPFPRNEEEVAQQRDLVTARQWEKVGKL